MARTTAGRDPGLGTSAANRVRRPQWSVLLRSEAVRFALVGGINTMFGFGVFAGLQSTLGRHTHYLVVLIVAQVIAVLEAYVLQRWLVFRVHGRWWRELMRFSSVYTVSLGVNVVALPLLVELVHLPVIWAQGIVMLVTALGTYLAHRNFTFRLSRAAASRPSGPHAAAGGDDTPVSGSPGEPEPRGSAEPRW